MKKALLVSLLLVPLAAPGIGARAPACEDAEAGLALGVRGPDVALAEVAPLLGALVEACGVRAPEPGLSLKVEEVVKVARGDCGDLVTYVTGVAPAWFNVHVFDAYGRLVTLPDYGVARVAGDGGSFALFDGDGAYSGVLAAQAPGLAFVKLGHVLVPADEGDASVHCVFGPYAGGSGWATFSSGGYTVVVVGSTLF